MIARPWKGIARAIRQFAGAAVTTAVVPAAVQAMMTGYDREAGTTGSCAEATV